MDQGILTFNSGDNSNVFTVQIVNDSIAEFAESFEIFLKPIPDIPYDVILTDPSVAIGTIFDDDFPSKMFYYTILFDNHFCCCVLFKNTFNLIIIHFKYIPYKNKYWWI